MRHNYVLVASFLDNDEQQDWIVGVNDIRDSPDVFEGNRAEAGRECKLLGDDLRRRYDQFSEAFVVYALIIHNDCDLDVADVGYWWELDTLASLRFDAVQLETT